jgi:hypothetical protein
MLGGAASPPDDPRRRLRAKRQNERVKLVATSLNTVALAIVAAALIVPSVSGIVRVRCVPPCSGALIG